jgi:serine/threonine-protein phosphatase 2A regulatory subunit A
MKSLEPIYMLYLKDKAAAVREYGVERINDLLRVFGHSWTNIFVMKLADILAKDSNHTLKITTLYSLRAVAISQVGDSAAEKIVSIITKSLQDPVPNVLMVAVKTMRDIARRYETTGLRDQIKKIIVGLAEDPDKDVKFYTAETLGGL